MLKLKHAEADALSVYPLLLYSRHARVRWRTTTRDNWTVPVLCGLRPKRLFHINTFTLASFDVTFPVAVLNASSQFITIRLVSQPHYSALSLSPTMDTPKMPPPIEFTLAQTPSSITGFITLPFEPGRQIIEDFAMDPLNHRQPLDSETLSRSLSRALCAVDKVGSWDIIDHLLHALKVRLEQVEAEKAASEQLGNEWSSAFEDSYYYYMGESCPNTLTDSICLCEERMLSGLDGPALERFFETKLPTWRVKYGAGW